eukprot:TRINITY_DN67580_c6_g2_i2.p1 TRINITY_DN67580_c6_g2~~TRINITY_DN67580_c6_g2_i2.p1  ORF type:complete len:296 (+),score=126.48 TRINITY_DN67580_c6_g2_i2:52-939(+)
MMLPSRFPSPHRQAVRPAVAEKLFSGFRRSLDPFVALLTAGDAVSDGSVSACRRFVDSVVALSDLAVVKMCRQWLLFVVNHRARLAAKQQSVDSLFVSCLTALQQASAAGSRVAFAVALLAGLRQLQPRGSSSVVHMAVFVALVLSHDKGAQARLSLTEALRLFELVAAATSSSSCTSSTSLPDQFAQAVQDYAELGWVRVDQDNVSLVTTVSISDPALAVTLARVCADTRLSQMTGLNAVQNALFSTSIQYSAVAKQLQQQQQQQQQPQQQQIGNTSAATSTLVSVASIGTFLT